MQRSCFRLGVIGAALVLLAGCAAKEPKVRALWPVPPEEPRIEFIGVYASEQDLPKSDTEKAAAKILGETPLYTFKSPFSAASDGQGKVYISDLHLNNVRVYDFNEPSVEFLVKEPMFKAAMDVELDGDGNLYVVDGLASKIWVFGPDRQVRRIIDGEGSLKRPTFLAIDDELDRLYVSDSHAHAIRVFDLASGRLLFSFGERGEGDGLFNFPQGLAIDAAHNLFVADRLNARIQVFDPDGNFLRMFGVRGDRFDNFEAPRDLAFDHEGNLWVVDQRRSAIYTYSPEGRILLITGGGQRTSQPLGFAMPSGISIDANGRIVVADMLNKRFSVWQLLTADYLQENPITDADLRRINEAIRGNREND